MLAIIGAMLWTMAFPDPVSFSDMDRPKREEVLINVWARRYEIIDNITQEESCDYGEGTVKFYHLYHQMLLADRDQCHKSE